MFLVNNRHGPEQFNHTCEKGCPCEPIPMALGDKEVAYKEVTKHFMAPLGNNTCDKGTCPCEPLPIGITEKDGKHFMTPLGPLQLTAEECNEILMKRAAAAAGTTQPNANQNHSPSQSPPDSKPLVTNQPAKIRPYSCLECGKSFLLKHHLTTHARVHSGERPHICIHCGKTFAHKHCLNTHLLLHSSQRPYQCAECKKSFTLKHHLLTHSRVETVHCCRRRDFVTNFFFRRYIVGNVRLSAPSAEERFRWNDTSLLIPNSTLARGRTFAKIAANRLRRKITSYVS